MAAAEDEQKERSVKPKKDSAEESDVESLSLLISERCCPSESTRAPGSGRDFDAV